MKILRVRFENLNSLCGEWSVDFTHPSYAADGIFAITGPTGAGKTTLLDAVCLALYGRTPRLNRVTKSANEIMSRQTGGCFAEVTFETPAGCFRSHWSQHRSRRKAGGELQPPKHEIVDAATGKVLESKMRDVAGCIERVTGMDFDRFTRSMLLAQGGFAVFLQAAPDERAPILEQITGTEIYSRISMKTHERRADERKKLDEMQALLAGIQLLSREEELGLRGQLKERQARETELAKRVEALQKALAWLDGITVLEKDIAALEDRRREFETRRQVFEPELKRLESANRALTLQGDHARVVTLRSQQDQEKKELGRSREQLPAHESDREAAVKQEQAASASLEQARIDFKQESNVIRRVREMDVRLADKRTQVNEAENHIRQAEKQRTACRTRIRKAEGALAASQTALADVERYLEDHAVDAGLVEDLAAVGRLFETLTEADQKQAGIQKARAEMETDKNRADKTLNSRRTAHEQAEAERKTAEKVHGQVVRELEDMLGGREPGDWHDELDAFRDRRRLLEQTGEILARMETGQRELNGLRMREDALNREQTQVAADISAVNRDKTQCERNVGHLETQAALLARIRDLEAERARLEDGKPCPLCGSLAHPFAEGNVPSMDATESDLRQAKETLEKVTDQLAGLTVQQARTETDLKQVRRDINHKKAALDADEVQCEKALERLTIEAGAQARAQSVRVALTDVEKRIAQVSKTIRGFEEKSRQEKAAFKSLEKARTAFIQSETALQTARHRQETAERELARLTRESEALADQRKRAADRALGAVSDYGISEITVAGLGGILSRLTARRDRWKARQAEEARHRKTIETLTSELRTRQALMENSQKDLEEKRTVRDALTQELNAWAGERHRLYGDKQPDAEEARLTGAVDRAEKALDRVRKTREQAEQVLTRLSDRITALTDSIRKRCTELNRTGEQLKERFRQAGFADEVEFLAACLPEDERRRLEKQAQTLDRERTELDTRQKDKAAALQSERDKKATEQPRDALQQNFDACSSDLQQARKEIVTIEHRLSENDTLRTRQQAHVRAIEAQKTECGRWDRLHELIGSADGKKFRNFAQGLTFEIMVSHANRQLRKMTDRYLLVRDEVQPLDLNVIDNYQAGEIRSTRNLSGGESFIVSLALALGLSRMAGRNVRIESLFLDEGFGTLDNDALETALETLAELRQDGKLIGVISHVPALRERIGTQIRIIPGPGGRSRITGPGCSHISV